MSNECINVNSAIVLGAIEKYMQGLNFPALKRDIIDQAQKNNASEDLLTIFETFLDKYYDDPIEIAMEFSRVLQFEEQF